MNLSSLFSTMSTAIGAVIAGIAGVVAALIWSRHRARWIAGIVIVTWGIVLLVWFRARAPEVDPRLPGLYRMALAWWLFALGAGAAAGLAHLIATRSRLRARGDQTREASFPDLEAAWDEILAALAVARIDPSRRRWYLLFGPEPAEIEALIEAAGVRPLTTAPLAIEAPIHAHATAEGILLNATGCTALGARAGGGDARLARLCELIRGLRPELPLVRGVTLVLPIDWAGIASNAPRAAGARDDLRRIAESLGVRAPTYVVLTRLESLPGGAEFLGRFPAEGLTGRCGFSMPASPGADPLPKSLSTGFGWLARWFGVWTLDLMVQDYTRHAGNASLMILAETIRGLRRNLEGLLAGLFAPADAGDVPLLRGVYLAAAGDGPGRRGFAAGLLAPPDARLLSDHRLAAWSGAAVEADRRDSRLARVLLAAASAIGLTFWAGPIRHHFAGADRTWVWVIGLGLLAAACVGLVLARGTRRETPDDPAVTDRRS